MPDDVFDTIKKQIQQAEQAVDKLFTEMRRQAMVESTKASFGDEDRMALERIAMSHQNSRDSLQRVLALVEQTQKVVNATQGTPPKIM